MHVGPPTPHDQLATPASDAARSALRARLRRVRSILRDDLATDADGIHRLRVAIRRAEAAIAAFAPVLDPDRAQRVRARLARIRRAAGRVRDADVRTALLTEVSPHTAGDLRTTIDEIVAEASLERARAERRLRRRLRERPPRRVTGSPGRLVRPSDRPVDDLMRERLAGLLADVRARAGSRTTEALHELRLAVKRLRYAAEVFAEPVPALDAIADDLGRLQAVLGATSDVAALLDALQPMACPSRPTVAALVGRAGLLLARREADARAALDDRDSGLDAVLSRLQHATAPPFSPPLPSPPPLHASNGHGRSLAPRRCAAIDVGTNSIRLLVAEVRDDGTHRVLDDEREASRLGAGLSASGRLDRDAMARSVAAVVRMHAIAQGYGANPIRVIGTAACRLARNTDEFASLLRRDANVELEVISEQDEARLAFASVAAAFDLRGRTVAVVDIGGGSTEVVLATNGVPEVVRSIPLGAVSLTEGHGGPEAVAGRGYKAMRRRVDRALRRIVETPIRPEIAIGTGGTFTTLGAMLVHRDSGSADASLWDRPVPGLEATRADARHTLERLRSMDAAQRTRVPGLPRERADIIVAGIAIVDRVLKHLGVNQFRVHDKGVRDGLIIAMARELAGAAAAPPDPMASVRRFAEACRYEREHSEHVTRLALSIFDQLLATPAAPRAEDRARARLILEAAGVLHDIGYLVNYAKHHKHGYHLILHADLPGWTHRDIRVVANVARYHRRAEPKHAHSNFASLAREDRELVRMLAGVLRVADGLDRTHMQRVRGVDLSRRDSVLTLTIHASRDADVDLWGSQAKSGLLERVLRQRVRLERRPEVSIAAASAVTIDDPLVPVRSSKSV